MESLSKKIILVFWMVMACSLSPLHAQAQSPSLQQEALLEKLQSYLNGIRTLRANFSQDNPNGTKATGRMYLKRLGRESFGKLRLDYNPPTLVKIIADGETLRHEDGETREVSEYPIDSTPASFLLRHRIEFGYDLEVKRIETAAEKIYLTLAHAGDEGVTLTLVFVTTPMLRLQEWAVVDRQANQTHVTLTHVEIGLPLDEGLFQF